MKGFLCLFSLLLLTTQVLAHHGYGGRYDRTTIAELEGELVSKLWRNPHVRLTIKDKSGDLWELEGSTASVLTKSGLTKDLVAIGDQLTVAGYPSTVGKKEMVVRNILLPSGKEVVMDPTRIGPQWKKDDVILPSRAPAVTIGDRSSPELGLFRTWSTVTRDPESKGIFPEAADAEQVWRYPLTESAHAAVKEFDPVTDNPLMDYCVGKGMPMIMDQPWGMEISDRGDSIVFRMEEFDSVRTVYMNNSNQAPVESSKFGYSTGHWDGDTLVVETSQVSWLYFSQMGVPQTENTVFVERFSPTELGSRLNYQLVATDPEIFSEPVTLKKYWIWDPTVEVGEYGCVE